MPVAQKESLIEQGVSKIFIDPDFRRISDQRSVPVSKILQKNVFKIGESGAEAAAVTDIVFSNASAGAGSETVTLPKMVFNADIPFIYLIRETTSAVVLFIGVFRG